MNDVTEKNRSEKMQKDISLHILSLFL